MSFFYTEFPFSFFSFPSLSLVILNMQELCSILFTLKAALIIQGIS